MGVKWAAGGGGGGSSWASGSVSAPGWPNTTTAGTGLYTIASTTEIDLAINGKQALSVTGSSTAVNAIQLQATVTGVTPVITNVGTDTNGAGLGIAITGKTATASGIGGPITIQGGDGNGTTQRGGSITIQGGQGGATTSIGGAITIQGGSGGATSGSGADVNINGGFTYAANGTGGSIIIGNTNQNPNDAGSGIPGNTTLSTPKCLYKSGNLTITTGLPTGSGGKNAGNITIQPGTSSFNTGASITITTGSGAVGGTLNISTADGGSSNSAGGPMNIIAGQSAGNGNGGTVIIQAGNQLSGSGTGGNLLLKAGGGTGVGYGGTSGTIKFGNMSTVYSTFDSNGNFGIVQAMADQSVDSVTPYVPTTGFSKTITSYTSMLLINPAGTLATGTIVFPASTACVSGQKLTIATSQTITSLTMTAGSGTTINGALTTLLANTSAKWIYNTAGTRWYRLY